MVLIVILPFLLAFALWKGRLRGFGGAFLAAAAACSGLMVVLTEALSRFDLITRNGLVAGWLVASVLVCLITRFVPRGEVEPANVAAKKWWIVPIVLAGVLGIVALIGPPNSFDSMTYHLPRVIHWIQDRNVDFYPVQTYPASQYPIEFYKAQQVRQLTMSPGAEYWILNLQIVSGSERFSAMVQWFAYGGCVIGVWSIAEVLGASWRGCAMAALFAATIPMACLQAVTTQNDLVCAFYLLSTVRFLRKTSRKNDSWFDATLCGVSLGLALLTKAVAYVYAGPFLIGWIVLIVIRQRWADAPRLCVVALIALLLNLPTYCRNYQYNHTLLGNSADDLPYSNASITVGHTVSNVVRNVALEMAFPPGTGAATVERSARSLDHLFGLDPDDPDSTFPFTQFNLANVTWNEEDCVPSPLHLILLLAVVIGAAKLGQAAQLHLAAIVLAFVGFCAYLRWQPWHARLHLSLFMLAGPCVGLFLERINRRLATAITALLVLSAVPWLAFNAHHPLFGENSIFTTPRDKLRFIERPQLLESFRQVASEAAKYREVGMIFTGDDWEYPLDVMLKEKNPSFRIETYPQPWMSRQGIPNAGWNPALKPYVIVQFDDGVPRIVGRSSGGGETASPK